MSQVRKKLIEVSIPLEAINVASAKEKSIRPRSSVDDAFVVGATAIAGGVPCGPVRKLVDDPSSWPDRFPTQEAQDVERARLHKIIKAMVPWKPRMTKR